MYDFQHKLMSSVHITEESALRHNILEKQRKREVAATVREVDQIDYEKAKTMASRIVSNITSNNNKEERDELESGDEVIIDIKTPQAFLSENRHLSTTPEDLSECWGLILAKSCVDFDGHGIETNQIGSNATGKTVQIIPDIRSEENTRYDVH